MLSVIMMNVTHKPFYDECRYAECRYAECRGAVKTLTLSFIDVIEGKDDIIERLNY
jgi:hypothetical protein